MSFAPPNSLWDLSLPPSLPSLADDEFIALLQKQFGESNEPQNQYHDENPDIRDASPAERQVSPTRSDDSRSSPGAFTRSISRQGPDTTHLVPFGEAFVEDHPLKRKTSLVSDEVHDSFSTS